ncbi:MAG TPA: DUF1570 domain-containing protein [Asticcacaulis sp.]|nr:DUF1570 domain-containing protein [Asticcacaulis sp.]
MGILAKSWVAGLCGLGLMASTAAPAAPWIKAQSDHFTVYSNVDAKTTSAYLTKLEQYRFVLERFYDLPPAFDEHSPRFNVYFLDGRMDLSQVKPGLPQGVAGFYTGCAFGDADFAVYRYDDIRETKTVADQAENDSQIILFHEYAHAFMFQDSSAIYPRWYVEGFAEYYGSTRIQGDQVEVGKAWSGRYRTLLGGEALPYEDLLRSAKSLQSSPEKTQAFYAQSWLLTHYFLATPEREDKLHAYFAAYEKGEDPVTAFERTTGIAVKDLPKVLDAYLQSKEAVTLTVHLKDMPLTANVAITPLPASAKKLLLWDAADRVCAMGDSKPLLANIRTEAAKFPTDDYAQLAWARAENILGDESLPLNFLTAYTQRRPDDPEGMFLLGLSYYLMTSHSHIADGETAETQMKKARNAFGKVYQLDPTNATNLYFFALAHSDLPDYPDDNTVTAAVEAHALAPSTVRFAVLAANLLIRTGKTDEAKTVLYPLASNPHNDKLSRWATAIIAAIDSGAKKEDLLGMLAQSWSN